MVKKRYAFLALIMTLILLALETVARFLNDIETISIFADVFNPVFVISSIACFYLAFKSTAKYPTKLFWIFFAVSFSLAMINFGYLINSVIYGSVITNIISRSLFCVGLTLTLICLVYKKISKLLFVGFGFLAVGNILSITIGVVDLVLYYGNSSFIQSIVSNSILLVVWSFFVVISLTKSAKLHSAFRNVIIILSLILLIGFNSRYNFFFYGSIIVLSFTMCPIKKFLRFKFSAIIALLFIILSVPTALNLGQLYRNIVENVENIAVSRQEYSIFCKSVKERPSGISGVREKINDYELLLSEAESALETAENKLDKVCYRKYYSSYYCNYKCKNLHNDVENCQEQYNAINSTLSNYRMMEKQLEFLSAVPGLIAIEITKMFSVVLSVASFIMFAVCILRRKFRKLAVTSSVILFMGTLFMLFASELHYSYYDSVYYYAHNSWGIFSFDLIQYPMFALLSKPLVWSGVASVFFSCIFTRKQNKVAKYRYFAIISLLIMLMCSASSRYFSIFVFYAIVMVFSSYIFAPIVFSEYNHVAKHIFLTIITLGVWQLIWIYNVTKNLNGKTSAKERKPVAQLLLCVFLPFYFVYWLCTTIICVENYGKEYNVKFRLSSLSLILSFICPIVSTAFIQDNINQIIEARQINNDVQVPLTV